MSEKDKKEFNGNRVEVVGVKTLRIVISKDSKIVVDYENCIVYQRPKNKTVVYIVGERGEEATSKTNTDVDESIPGIVAGGDVVINQSGGMIAIGSNITQDKENSINNIGTAVLSVPKGTAITLDLVDDLEIGDEDRSLVKIEYV